MKLDQHTQVLLPAMKWSTVLFMYGLLYCFIAASTPGASMGDIAKALGEMWKGFCDEDKKRYQVRHPGIITGRRCYLYSLLVCLALL